MGQRRVVRVALVCQVERRVAMVSQVERRVAMVCQVEERTEGAPQVVLGCL